MNLKYTFCLFCFFWVCTGSLCAQYRSGPTYPIHAIELHVSPSNTRLAYRLNEVHSRGTMDLALGISYQLQLSKFLTLAFSVDHRRYFSQIDFSNQCDSVDMNDGFGEKYFLHLVLNTTEKQVYQAIELSVRAQSTFPLNAWVAGLFEIGASYGIRYREVSQLSSGTFSKYAYFYEHHTLVDQLPSMNLGTYQGFINPISGPLFRNSILVRVGAGFRFYISERIGANAIATLHYGIPNLQGDTDILNHHASYSGIASSAIKGGVHPLAIGIELGVFYRFIQSRGSSVRKLKKCWECPY